MTADTQTLLESWMALRDLPEDQIRQRLQIGEGQSGDNQHYMSITGLTILYNEETLPGPLYLRDRRFFLLYADQASPVITEMDGNALKTSLGDPEATLASRVGPFFLHYVYPEKGVAFSANQGEVGLLEIFQPTTLQGYKKTFYIEPDEFIR